MAAPNGGQVFPAPPHRPNRGVLQLRADAVLWKDGNPNRAVDMVKVDEIKVTFLTEDVFVKTKNKELSVLYDDLKSINHKVRGASQAAQREQALQDIMAYRAILDKIRDIRQQIKEKKELALPIPNKLRKIPKVPKLRMV